MSYWKEIKRLLNYQKNSERQKGSFKIFRVYLIVISKIKLNTRETPVLLVQECLIIFHRYIREILAIAPSLQQISSKVDKICNLEITNTSIL